MADPVTDEEIESDRALYHDIPRHHIARYIARIDAERAAREMAEARVKVLGWALGRIDSLLPTAEHLPGLANDALRGLLLMIGDQVAALKEPSNG